MPGGSELGLVIVSAPLTVSASVTLAVALLESVTLNWGL